MQGAAMGNPIWTVVGVLLAFVLLLVLLGAVHVR
jgi:hypothetical protein